MQKLWKLPMMAHCDEFVNKLPNGYDTTIGENGCELPVESVSDISIARAFLKMRLSCFR